MQNLSITGSTTLERNDYPAVFLNSSADDWSVNVKLGSGVTLRSAGLFGALWVRSESANTAFRNDIYIDSAATVVATGSDTVGITATSNNGKVTLINRGSVTSTQSRGLYADGGNVTKPDTVLIRNEGTVQAYQAAARAINYAGTSRIENTGSVRSTTAQGLVAWSNMGGAEIINSGTVVADNYDARRHAGLQQRDHYRQPPNRAASGRGVGLFRHPRLHRRHRQAHRHQRRHGRVECRVQRRHDGQHRAGQHHPFERRSYRCALWHPGRFHGRRSQHYQPGPDQRHRRKRRRRLCHSGRGGQPGQQRHHHQRGRHGARG
ncbi:hypothetical protein D3C72_1328520 [compost metagenome]